MDGTILFLATLQFGLKSVSLTTRRFQVEHEVLHVQPQLAESLLDK